MARQYATDNPPWFLLGYVFIFIRLLTYLLTTKFHDGWRGYYGLSACHRHACNAKYVTYDQDVNTVTLISDICVCIKHLDILIYRKCASLIWWLFIVITLFADDSDEMSLVYSRLEVWLLSFIAVISAVMCSCRPRDLHNVHLFVSIFNFWKLVLGIIVIFIT